MKPRMAYSGSLMVAIGVSIVMGCAVTRPAEFYLLHSMPTSEVTGLAESEAGSPSVLIGPVTLPGYLDRSQIVTLTKNHKVELNEFNRWAEPLQNNVYRVLVENLSLLLKSPKIYAAEPRGPEPIDFRVIIDVTRFDTTDGADAYLTAFWTIIGEDGNRQLMQRKSVFHATAPTADTAGAVVAQNLILTDFSREIATAILSLHQ